MDSGKALQVQDHQAHPQGPYSSSRTAGAKDVEEVLQVLREAEVQKVPMTRDDVLQVQTLQQLG